MWECAVDLVGFLAKRSTSVGALGPDNVVLEVGVVQRGFLLTCCHVRFVLCQLGCGHGLPGLYCLQQGSVTHIVVSVLTTDNTGAVSRSVELC